MIEGDMLLAIKSGEGVMEDGFKRTPFQESRG